MLTPSGILDLQQFCVLLYFELWYLPWTALDWLDWILFYFLFIWQLGFALLSSQPTLLDRGWVGVMVCDGGPDSLTVSPCLALIFLSPRQTYRSLLSHWLSYQAGPGRTSLLSLLSRMTSDLSSVSLSKSHCKCFQVRISFQKRHKKPTPCVCSNIFRSSPTQHVPCWLRH